ncbi:acetyl-CoA carboxylase biotin carboxyl carrier protein [Pseudalkalibacillus hwajinpoensis]|uniref:Biotin carboxyl carrier protein of acetyl-CoA carboxylase n=1 Tax=Guptibacillus hwajinpoensis TaxID=208199 RepID=A0A4U1MHV2_9BACL|nr:acetyl-CoA carboxylase biotin carboxyl carrier protein [Pseudalkalibacillus hwajinpoensis]TKD70064.1 acetyl-CoA carboxylase biotin carboxyl carrier protein [Pseudalkalibacillus hwajinpoensis]
MLKVQEIRELIKLIDQSSIDEFEYENDGSKIVLKKNEVQYTQAPVDQPIQQPVAQEVPEPAKPAAATPEQPKEEATNTQADESLHKIESPMVGTFYARPNPDSDVYVKTGEKVSENSVVCIIEAMKLFNEIEAEVNGEIVEMLVEDGQLVEYGQPLFLVKA